MRRAWGWALLLLVVSPLATLAADHAPRDTTLDAYIRRLADSTDIYYGGSTAGPDTTGLDSVLARFLADPRRDPVPQRSRSLALGPFLHFDRADGGVFGVSAGAGLARGPGRLGGVLAWANGPDEWRGGAEWSKRFATAGAASGWNARAWAGRTSVGFDRDSYDPTLASLRAFAFGSDYYDWLRRDGVRVSLEREAATWRAGIGWRDMLESSIPQSATWTLFGGRADRHTNDSAAFGRTRELELTGSVRVPGSPLLAEAGYATSGAATGSDFTYRRLRLATGGELNLSRHLVLVPQIEYGRLRGQAVPQAAFFLGGRSSLRSLQDNALTGTGMAFGRLELVLADDLGTLLGIEALAPPAIHLGAFAGSGAMWGRDDPGSLRAYAGHPAPTARDVPDAQEWLSEAGLSVMWRPGLPDPNAFLRAEYAIPIGPDSREPRWQFSFQRALNLLRPFE